MAANMITGIRMVCALILLPCPTFSVWFLVLYLLGGISDVLDGAVARHAGVETKFGARLDTIADILFTAVILLKTLPFMTLPLWIWFWIGCIAVIKCVSFVGGWVLHGRFVPEHTVMNKVCGVLLFALPLCIGLLPQKVFIMLLLLTCGIATVAAVQEGHYIRIGKETD